MEPKDNKDNQLQEEVFDGGTSASEAATRPAEVDPFDPQNYKKAQDPRFGPWRGSGDVRTAHEY
jgi:hypothetical protein